MMPKVPAPYKQRRPQERRERFVRKYGGGAYLRALRGYTAGPRACLQLEDEHGGAEVWMDQAELGDIIADLTRMYAAMMASKGESDE